MIEIGDRDVKDMRIGESVIYRDSDGWIPLKLPDTVIDGCVLFRDNGDGTASLVGSIRANYSGTASGPLTHLLTPPDGYEFSDPKWNQDYLSKGIMAFYNLERVWSGSPISVWPVILDGNLYGGSNHADRNSNITFFFSASTSEVDVKESGPAIIGIKKV